MNVILFKFRLSEDVGEFIATNDWQVVKEGQTLPAGLHVRLNLETGLREAKLLEADESSSNSNSIVAVPSGQFQMFRIVQLIVKKTRCWRSEMAQEEISRRNLEEAFARLDLTRDDVPFDQVKFIAA